MTEAKKEPVDKMVVLQKALDMASGHLTEAIGTLDELGKTELSAVLKEQAETAINEVYGALGFEWWHDE
jgi:hypothetical protein